MAQPIQDNASKLIKMGRDGLGTYLGTGDVKQVVSQAADSAINNFVPDKYRGLAQ